MAYQIKKQERITEDLELLAPDNSVALTVHIDVSPETIARDFRSVQLQIAKAKQVGDMTAFGNASIALFSLLFGKEATQQILNYFDGAYIDMAVQLLPFIHERIYPAIERCTKSRKEMFANNANLSRKQRRKLGI